MAQQPGGPPPVPSGPSPKHRVVRILLTFAALPALVGATIEIGPDWPAGGSVLLRVYFVAFLVLAWTLWGVGVTMPRPPLWRPARLAVFTISMMNIVMLTAVFVAMLSRTTDQVLRTGFISDQVYAALVLLIVGGLGAGGAGAGRIQRAR